MFQLFRVFVSGTLPRVVEHHGWLSVVNEGQVDVVVSGCLSWRVVVGIGDEADII